MDDTTLHTGAVGVTIIEALQKRYDAAGDAVDALQRAQFGMADSPEGRVRSCWLEEGEQYASEEQSILEPCILNQQPVTWLDACILAAHIESIGSDFIAYTPEYQKKLQEPLARGMESLLVFIADEHDIDTESSEFLRSVAGRARRNVLMRTGRPEQDAWLNKEEA